MRILYIAGGDSPHAYRWIKYFADKGHICHWFVTRKYTQPLIHSNTTYRFSYGFKLLDLLDLISNFKPDIVHAHYAGVNGLLGSLSGFKPFVLTAWGSDVLITGKHWLKKYPVNWVLKQADLVTCDANHMILDITNRGINHKRIERINFGVDTTVFCPNKIHHNTTGIISLRNLEPIYNVETLIRAVPLVNECYKNTMFYIAGDGSQRNYLNNLILKLNIAHNTVLIGTLNQMQVLDWLSRSDIYVSTSLSDAGISASTAEAMACGLPCLITDNSENKEWCSHLFQNRDYRTLAEYICKFIESPGYAKLVGMKNRRIIETHNNYHTEMEKMERLYEQVIGNR